MELKSTLINKLGQKLEIIYQEQNPLLNLEGKILQAVHAFCFYGEKMVIVYSEAKGYWSTPGGGTEPGESVEEAVVREVKEETNMKVLSQELIGYQDIYEPDRIVRQTRSICIVEPYGPFESDGDAEGRDVTEIKLIDPHDYKEYFDWGPIGDRIMQRALELRIDL